LITEVYAAFNRRDIDGALALMSEQVDWPKASEGGRIIGKDEIRAYWGGPNNTVTRGNLRGC
jgi:ketosteroid isomerase-like protein